LSTNVDEAHRRAEPLFKKEQQLREDQQAMAEYQAELRAMRKKTARLRALRLARDAANQAPALTGRARRNREKHLKRSDRCPMSTLDAELNDFGAQLAMLGGHAADRDG
jgi:hypothetical protein